MQYLSSEQNQLHYSRHAYVSTANTQNNFPGQEFFEKRKHMKRIRVLRGSPRKSRGVNQDLISLHTITKIYDTKPGMRTPDFSGQCADYSFHKNTLPSELMSDYTSAEISDGCKSLANSYKLSTIFVYVYQRGRQHRRGNQR